MGANRAQRASRSVQCLLRIAAVLACMSAATAASAQYRIEASGCGPQPDLVSTVELELTRLGGAGSPESGSSYTECNSGISAVSGEMFASTNVSFETGSIGLLPAVSIASFRDQLWIDGLGPGQTALISATFAAAGNAEIAGGSGSSLASATLNVAGCRITRTWRSSGTVSDTPNCGLADSMAYGEAGGVGVLVTIPYEFLGPSPLGNYVQVQASLRAEAASLSAPAVALAQIGGTLSLAGSGDGAQRFTYPEVLSVPEPGSVATVAAALAALALRHRLGRQVRSPAPASEETDPRRIGSLS